MGPLGEAWGWSEGQGGRRAEKATVQLSRLASPRKARVMVTVARRMVQTPAPGEARPGQVQMAVGLKGVPAGLGTVAEASSCTGTPGTGRAPAATRTGNRNTEEESK